MSSEATRGVTFYRHPDYIFHRPYWRTYRDLFEGRHDKLISPIYLWMHEMESLPVVQATIKRRIREERSQYTNLIEPFVSRLTALFFKNDPDTKEVEDMFGDEINNVDGSGKSLISFLKEDVVPMLLLYGKPYIIVQGPAKTASSKAEEKAQGLRPYLSIVSPLELVDWDIETEDPARRGQFNFFRTEYEVVPPRKSAAEKPDVVKFSKVFEVVPGGYTVTLYRGEKLEKAQIAPDSSGRDYPAMQVDIEHEYSWKPEGPPIEIPGWDHIPISTILFHESWVREIAPLTLRYFNLESSLDNQLLYQAHQRIFIVSDMDNTEKLGLAEYTATFLPIGSSVQTVQPSPTDTLTNRLNHTLSLISKIGFNQTRSLPHDARSVERAETIREQKEEFLDLALSTISDIENLAAQFVADYAAMKGIPNFTGRLRFERDLTLIDVATATQQYLAMRDDIVKVPSWHKGILEKVASEQNLTDIETIIEDINNTDFQPQQTANPAATIRAGLLKGLSGGQNNNSGSGQGAGQSSDGQSGVLPQSSGQVAG